MAERDPFRSLRDAFPESFFEKRRPNLYTVLPAYCYCVPAEEIDGHRFRASHTLRYVVPVVPIARMTLKEIAHLSLRRACCSHRSYKIMSKSNQLLNEANKGHNTQNAQSDVRAHCCATHAVLITRPCSTTPATDCRSRATCSAESPHKNVMRRQTRVRGLHLEGKVFRRTGPRRPGPGKAFLESPTTEEALSQSQCRQQRRQAYRCRYLSEELWRGRTWVSDGLREEDVQYEVACVRNQRAVPSERARLARAGTPPYLAVRGPEVSPFLDPQEMSSYENDVAGERTLTGGSYALSFTNQQMKVFS